MQAVGVGGALAVILIWVLESYVIPDPFPSEVAGAVTLIVSWMSGYFIPERSAV
jgi:hypothetical protein